MMTPITLSVAYSTDASASTHTTTKGHITPHPQSCQHNKCHGATDGIISIMLLPCTWQKLICTSNGTYMQHISNNWLQIWDNYVSICTSYGLTAINNVIKGTGIHTFHITDIYPEKICLSHCTYVTHPSKINKLQHLFTILLQIYASNKYALKMPKICNMLLDMHLWGSMPVYKPWKKSLWAKLWLVG